MDLNSLMTMRSQILEQYAQVHADLDALKNRRHNLKKRADSLLDDLRQLTHQINNQQTSAAPLPEPALV